MRIKQDNNHGLGRMSTILSIHMIDHTTKHSLDHKCGTCKTVLSNPRAKKTCFGVHEEVCSKYHKTLFYVGKSQRCLFASSIGTTFTQICVTGNAHKCDA